MKPKTIDETIMKRLTTAHTNFSSSVNAQTRLKVIAESKPLIDAHKKCKEIWQALQVADYKKEGALNDAALGILMDKQGKNLMELLLVKNVEDILDLLDEDEDGFLNEDEQIMIFSTIKERMQMCSEELCKVHEYGLFKEIMKGIRLIEDDINTYQKIFRSRNQKKELSAYYEIGEQRLKKFLHDWDLKFEDFENDCQERMEKLQSIHTNQMQELNVELEKDTDIFKIKPKAIIKNLQIKERLIAVNERFGEAQIIRNELKQLEIQEQNRVENLILLEKDKQRSKLRNKQEKEIEFVMLKNRASYNKLLIQKEQERIKLDKQIKLHLNDITKSQNLASSLAEKLAKSRDELRRSKLKSKKVKVYLGEAKKLNIRGKSSEVLPRVMIAGNNSKVGVQSTIGASYGYRSVSPLKKSLHNITKFKIKSDYLNQDTPVNAPPDYLNNTSLSCKAGKIMQLYSKHNKPLPSISLLYDDKLILL
ncbi:hypothetical protein SteCoe_29979 [Stentor coeruleus]|uniref:EF-hand domain-containing protein n=1 Tax=Stentor coeruleus TaxID=5963 RepID=A0A1R2B4Y1_9CILI|nr:hypothetical protein SteCoe_29979 [Stentor coeruleus]